MTIKGTSSPGKELPRGHGICLDLGAGEGRLRQSISDRGYSWIGLDIKRHRALTIVADAHELPFRNDAIHVVFMNAVLEHLHHPYKALHEIHRVIDSSGLLHGWAAFLEPYHESYFHFTFRGLETILNDCGFGKTSIWAGPHMFNSIIENYLPFIPGNLRAKLVKRLASLHARIGLWYLRRSRTTVDGVATKNLTPDDILRKFAEGYTFSASKASQAYVSNVSKVKADS